MFNGHQSNHGSKSDHRLGSDVIANGNRRFSTDPMVPIPVEENSPFLAGSLKFRRKAFHQRVNGSNFLRADERDETSSPEITTEVGF
jgi:hypothetical protein